MSQNQERRARREGQHVQRSGGRTEQVKLERLSRAAVVEAWCLAGLGRPPAPGRVTPKAVSEVETSSWGQWEPRQGHSREDGNQWAFCRDPPGSSEGNGLLEGKEMGSPVKGSGQELRPGPGLDWVDPSLPWGRGVRNREAAQGGGGARPGRSVQQGHDHAGAL